MKKSSRIVVAMVVVMLAFAVTAQALVITAYNEKTKPGNVYGSWYSYVTKANLMYFDVNTRTGNVLHPAPKTDFPLDARYDGTVNTTVATTNGYIDLGVSGWRDSVVAGTTPTTTTFTFDSPQQAFGGYWDLSPGQYGQGLAIYFDNVLAGTIVQSASGDQPGLWYWTSDVSFSNVTIMAISGQEEFLFQDMEYGMYVVPEPSTIALMGAGLGCALFWLRRKQD